MLWGDSNLVQLPLLSWVQEHLYEYTSWSKWAQHWDRERLNSQFVKPALASPPWTSRAPGYTSLCAPVTIITHSCAQWTHLDSLTLLIAPAYRFSVYISFSVFHFWIKYTFLQPASPNVVWTSYSEGKKYLIPCWFCTFSHWQRNNQSISLMVGLFEQWETE